MSAQMFRDFCIPFDRRFYDAFGTGLADGRGMHMCGQSGHLHSALTDELHISSFNTFGHLVAPATAAERFRRENAGCGERGPDAHAERCGSGRQGRIVRVPSRHGPARRLHAGRRRERLSRHAAENINALVEARESYGTPVSGGHCARERKRK